MIRTSSKLLIGLVLLVFSCIEPYSPPITDIEAGGMMVVDGFIDATSNVATVKLSFAQPLAEAKPTSRVTKANVWIEDEQENRISLFESQTGTYSSNGAVFNKEKKYRLRVNRGAGTDYNSDYIELPSTPPIDSVTWEADDLDVVFQVTTHDPESKATYFKWDFLETYEFTSPLQSTMKAVGNTGVFRLPGEQVYLCYQTDPSKDILTTSIEQLTDKVVYKYPVYRLYGGDLKLQRAYSIIVRQQTLTKEAYFYWSSLKATTQNLGGLFDPMPAEVRGNIHSSNKEEIVLGYFYGSEVSQKRMFIRLRDLPDNILHISLIRECNSWQIKANEVYLLDSRTLILGPITDLLGNVVAYQVADEICADCRKHRKGGTTTKPDFWP